MVNLSLDAISKIERGERGLREIYVERFCKVFGVTPSELYGGGGDIGLPFDMESLRKIPAYNDMKIAAGQGKELHAYLDHTDFVYFKTNRKNVRAIKIEERSYSMNRVALPGQYIVVDFDVTDPDECDGKYVVAFYEGENTFKKFCRKPDRLIPCSDMTDYNPITITEHNDFRIVGKVIGVVGDQKEFE